jgi:uncharacterized protein YggE
MLYKSLIYSCVFAIALPLFSQEKSVVSTIVVEGTAEMEVDPDIIVLSLSAQEKENLNRESAMVNMENQIIQFLDKIGIDRKNFTIERLYFAEPAGWSNKVRLEKNYQLIVDRPALLDTIIVQCMKLGMDNITIRQTRHSRIDSLQNVLLANAAANAKIKAALIAAGLNVKPGRVVEAYENRQLYARTAENYAGDAIMYGVMAKERISSSLQVEKIHLTKSVIVKFAIE